MLDKIQPEDYSTGGDREDILCISTELQWQPVHVVLVLQWQVLERQLQLAQQRLEPEQSFGGSRATLFVSLLLLLGKGVFFYEASLPAAQHPASFIYFKGQGNIFFTF